MPGRLGDYETFVTYNKKRERKKNGNHKSPFPFFPIVQVS